MTTPVAWTSPSSCLIKSNQEALILFHPNVVDNNRRGSCFSVETCGVVPVMAYGVGQPGEVRRSPRAFRVCSGGDARAGDGAAKTLVRLSHCFPLTLMAQEVLPECDPAPASLIAGGNLR